MLSVALKIALRVDFHCCVILFYMRKYMYGRQRANVAVERLFSTVSSALHALFLIYLRAYTRLKNYATEEIHLSVGSTVFGLKIFFGSNTSHF